MKHFKSWGTSFSVWSNNLKFCRSRCLLPTEFIVNHMHLYCLSLGKQLSPEETSCAQVCINKPTHRVYCTRRKSTPKHRCGNQTVNFPTWRREEAMFHCYGKPGYLLNGPSTITHLIGVSWFAFAQKVVFSQGHSFPASNLQSGWNAFEQRVELEDKVHPSIKGVLEKDHQKSSGSQADGAHHWHEQTASEAEVSHLLQGWQLLHCMTKPKVWHHFASVLLQCFSHILNKLLTSVQIQLIGRKTQTVADTWKEVINTVCLILYSNWACTNHNFSIFY